MTFFFLYLFFFFFCSSELGDFYLKKKQAKYPKKQDYKISVPEDSNKAEYFCFLFRSSS